MFLCCRRSLRLSLYVRIRFVRTRRDQNRRRETCNARARNNSSSTCGISSSSSSLNKKKRVLKSVRSQKETTPPRVCVRVCARVTLSQELSRGLIARARVWPSAYKVLRVAAFFFKCRFSFFFFSFWKNALRYVTYEQRSSPLPKCAFFEKTTGFTTHARRHKKKKKENSLPARARAKKKKKKKKKKEVHARSRRRRLKRCRRLLPGQNGKRGRRALTLATTIAKTTGRRRLKKNRKRKFSTARNA